MPNETSTPGILMANNEQIIPATTIQNIYDVSDPEHKKRLDHILSGLSVLTFTHTKTGTVHQLIGKDNAEYIGFTATADYQEGDTWELNGIPLTAVNFYNGEPLCVGGLITGDTVLGRVKDGVLTLFLDRPGSNPNILYNWYFVDPINQRGQTEYTESGYGIDRWRTWDDKLTVTLNPDGIILMNNSTDKPLLFTQYIEKKPLEHYSGNSVTISALLSNGTFFTATGMIFNYIYSQNHEIDFDISNNDKMRFSISIAGGDSIQVIAAKLELGPRQTLAHKDADGNWVLNDPPPNKQQELAKCQRYFVRIGGVAGKSVGTFTTYNASSGNLVIPVSVTMRTNPVVSFYGSFEFRGSGQSKVLLLDGKYLSLKAGASVVNDNLNNISIDFPVNEMFNILTYGDNSYIDISADL